MAVVKPESAASRGKGIGQRVPRKEDLRLLTGKGRFSDDVNAPGQAYAVMLRTPHAHARIFAIDVAAAKAMPGVLAVLTGHDAAADKLGPMPLDHKVPPPPPGSPPGPEPALANFDGRPIPDTVCPLLPHDVVRFAGQAVAMIVAETVAQAKDAAEAIEVEYEPLPAMVDARVAVKSDAAPLYPELGSNVVVEAKMGDFSAAEAGFAKAAHITRLETKIQRITGVPMEPRSCVGWFEKDTGRYILHAGSGGIVRQKRELAGILGVSPDKVRVTADDIGGNFGTRNSLFPEFPLSVWAAKKLGRPVKWTAERTESFLSDHQGRDQASVAELALDKDGLILAMRVDTLSNVGSYAASMVPLRKGMTIATGLYRAPAAHVRGRTVLTNTPPTIPYRSAGRPEAMYLIERLMDLTATEMGIDRIELRRRNLVRPDELPYRNPIGCAYDSGEYERAMDEALRLSDWAGFPARKAEAAKRGMLRGIGLGNYIEITMGAPREWASVTVKPDGFVDVLVGTLSSGQAHETTYAQCVSDWLGVAFEQVRIIERDTDIIPVGGGSHSGRSMRMAGFVMGKASDVVIERAKRIAAILLDATPETVDFADGLLMARGTNRKISLFEAAEAGLAHADLPAELKGALTAQHEQLFLQAGFPYGSAVAEVEIDPDTGALELVRYSAVDDVGRAINPMVLDGQTHGGIAQGVGQALWENVHYDPESGQLLSASFMDYAMPRADKLPRYTTALSEVPAPSNPLGVRAGGEGGTTPALGATMNAVADALAPLGIRHLDMPASPQRIWDAIQSSRKS
jgi:carbon-monoxide dehydrogenase large subunit